MSENDTLSAHQVAAWLRRHPQFLAGYPDLALSLVMPREDGKASSLASYQLEVLREKNRELQRRLVELNGNAQENERLAVRTQQLALALMRAGDAASTVRAMVACLREDFQGDEVRMVLFAPVAGLEAEWLQVIPRGDARLAPFADALASPEPICGRLNADKLQLLFGEEQKNAASVALLALPKHGLVAIGSRDPNRFFPGIGTLFLRMMAQTLETALERHGAG